MSKSDGDFLRLASLVERGLDPLAYPYLCLTAHYRKQLTLGRARRRDGSPHAPALRALADVAVEPDERQLVAFSAQLDDDLNLPRAIAVVWETLRGSLSDGVKRATLARFDDVLGLGLRDWLPREGDPAPPHIEALAERARRRVQPALMPIPIAIAPSCVANGWEIETSGAPHGGGLQ